MTAFTPDSFDFFADLQRDNTKAFWLANKSRFDQNVRAPFTELLSALAGDWGPFKPFRMHRDTRFSPDKSPYKLMQGALSQASPYRYLHMDRSGILVAAGGYVFSKDQLAAFRAALQDPAQAERFHGVVAALQAQGIDMDPGGAKPLQSAPRGVPADHPMIAYLRWKGAVTLHRIPSDTADDVAQIAQRVSAFWATTQPLIDWLP